MLVHFLFNLLLDRSLPEGVILPDRVIRYQLKQILLLVHSTYRGRIVVESGRKKETSHCHVGIYLLVDHIKDNSEKFTYRPVSSFRSHRMNVFCTELV